MEASGRNTSLPHHATPIAGLHLPLLHSILISASYLILTTQLSWKTRLCVSHLRSTYGHERFFLWYPSWNVAAKSGSSRMALRLPSAILSTEGNGSQIPRASESIGQEVRTPAERGLCSTCTRIDWRYYLHRHFEALEKSDTIRVFVRKYPPGPSEETTYSKDWSPEPFPISPVLISKKFGDGQFGRNYPSFSLLPVSLMTLNEKKCSICKMFVEALAALASQRGISSLSDMNEPLTVAFASEQIVSCFHYWRDLPVLFVDLGTEGPLGSITAAFTLFTTHSDLTLESISIEGAEPLVRPLISPGQVDLGTIKCWWEACRADHQHARDEFPVSVSCLDYNNSHFQGRVRIIPNLRVIDVTTRWVVQPGNLCKYVALSYVWGDVDIYRAQSRDFITVPDSQGAESSQSRYLPLQGISPCQNILDAISIVEAIGEKYLRVDTLCILQDDPEDVATVLKNMDKIFEPAILTIIAASGTNADSGLIERKGTFSSVTGFVGGIGLVEIKRWPTDLRECPWSQRGWCYQEDHFSTKCFIFAYNRVFYECPSGYWVETRPRGRLGRALRDRVKPIRTDGELVSNSPVDGGPTLDFEEYADHVRAYSKRKLTFENDILNAFSGIMAQMSERSGSPFCWGLPIDHFMSALMWSPSKDAKRRKTCSDQENAVSFPSWSWAGWTGSFLYEAFFYNGFTFMPEHYDSSIVWPWEQHCGIPTGKEVFSNRTP